MNMDFENENMVIAFVMNMAMVVGAPTIAPTRPRLRGVRQQQKEFDRGVGRRAHFISTTPRSLKANQTHNNKANT
jgi:hypothetical protein